MDLGEGPEEVAGDQPLEEGESDRVHSEEERSRPGRTDEEVELEEDAEAEREAAEKDIEEINA